MPVNFSDHNPTTLEEAIDAIIAGLNDEERKYIEFHGTVLLHHGPCRAMRNSWCLWDEKSPLSRHFDEVYGITHADDKSGMIMRGVEARVRNAPFFPKELAESYINFWKETHES